MIQIYISYFYQIRFFKKNMIPISTALYDPKWYYNGHQGHFYKDHNGVYNGFVWNVFDRVEPLVLVLLSGNTISLLRVLN